MNRKVIVIIAILVVAANGCTQRSYQQSEPVVLSPTSTIVPTQSLAENTPQPDATLKPQESADVELSAVYIDDDVITIDLPAGISQSTSPDVGRIYQASGYASPTQQGNYYTIEVLRFFAVEDPLTSMADLLLYDESMEYFAYGKDMDYKSIMSNITFADGMGHISKISYNNTEKYTATLSIGEIYYRIIVKAEGNYSSDDLALKMLTSIQLNGANAAAKAQSFKINLQNNTYYSQKQEGASIMCPTGWQPSESMYFSLNNSILSIMTEDKLATATVRYYSNSSLSDVKSYSDFTDYMLMDLLNRELIDTAETDRIQCFVEENKRSFCMPPTEHINIRYYLEYTDGYYCIELMYKGTDANTVAQLLDIGESFVGVGEETRH